MADSPRTTTELLPQRRTLLRRVARGLPVPSIADLEHHAERYGTDCIVLTAADLGYGYNDLLRLQDACDRIEVARFRREHPLGRLPRVAPSEERVKALLGIVEEKEETHGHR